MILGVTAEAKSSRDALDGAGRTMQAILDFVTAQGIEASDIQTDAIRLNPRYGHNANGQIDYRIIVGYTAETTVRLRLQDINIVGEVLAGAVEAGANRIDGISFGLKDETGALDEARRLAVVEARRKAAFLAEAEG